MISTPRSSGGHLVFEHKNNIILAFPRTPEAGCLVCFDVEKHRRDVYDEFLRRVVATLDS